MASGGEGSLLLKYGGKKGKRKWKRIIRRRVWKRGTGEGSLLIHSLGEGELLFLLFTR